MSVDVGALQRELAMCKMPFYKGAYGAGTTQAAIGIDTHPGAALKKDLDERAAAGERVIVWLGSYNRGAQEQLCEFERDDDWIRKNVGAVAGHPAILAYQIADELNQRNCDPATAVPKLEARRALINSVDPTKPTYATLKTGTSWAPYANIADLYGLVAYVTLNNRNYNEPKIPNVIAAAESAGLSEYGAIMQFFGNKDYRMPTPTELQHQFDQWTDSRWRGYLLYKWSGTGTTANGDELPEHRAVIQGVNAGL